MYNRRESRADRENPRIANPEQGRWKEETMELGAFSVSL
jgi:hypothetical protein